MVDFGFGFGGDIEDVTETMEDLQENASGGGTWFVGTAVEYSIYLEFGTSKMDAKPFVRPALAEARRDLESFIKRNTEREIGDFETAGEVVRAIAFALERKIKEIITKKSLIDTGTLRASVLAVPADPSALPEGDDLETDEQGNPIDARQTVEVSA